MKKSAFLFFICFISFFSFVSMKNSASYFIDFKLCTIHFENDSNLKIETPQIKIDINKVSEITPIYKSALHTYGVQFEIFESALNNEKRQYARTAFYYKDKENWILINEDNAPTNIFLNKEKPSESENKECNYSFSTNKFKVEYGLELYSK